MQDAALETHRLISRAEALLLADTVELLRAVESRAGTAGWKQRTIVGYDGPNPYDCGRCAESCSRAAQEIQNALITLSVWGKSAAAGEALDSDADGAA